MGGANTGVKASHVPEGQSSGYNNDFYDWSKNMGKYEKKNDPLNPDVFPYEKSKAKKVTASSLVDKTSFYSNPVQSDRERVIQQGFNPEESQYDYLTAEQAGIKPNSENKHMGSVAPVTKEIFNKYKEYGLPEGEAYVILKGAKHPTHNYTVKAENERGFEIKKFGDRYFSVPKQKPESIYGYPIRKPYQSESDFFKNRPEVAGMATEDNAITLNPYSKNTPAQQNLVAQNEAIRQYLKENKVSPSFNLTPEQEAQFAKTEYGQSKDKNPLKHSIIARILTGDPSAGNTTQEQINQANLIKQKLDSLTKKPTSSYDVINAEL